MPPPPPPPLAKRRASPGRSPRLVTVLCRVHQPLRRPGRGASEKRAARTKPPLRALSQIHFQWPRWNPGPPERQLINTHPAAHSSLPPSGSGRRAADAGQGRTPTPPARLGARGVRSPPHTGVGGADLPRKKLGEERGPSLQTSRQGYRHL